MDVDEFQNWIDRELVYYKDKVASTYSENRAFYEGALCVLSTIKNEYIPFENERSNCDSE